MASQAAAAARADPSARSARATGLLRQGHRGCVASRSKALREMQSWVVLVRPGVHDLKARRDLGYQPGPLGSEACESLLVRELVPDRTGGLLMDSAMSLADSDSSPRTSGMRVPRSVRRRAWV
jgi:hypothetical protein